MPGLLTHAEIRQHIESLLVQASDPVQKGVLLVLLDIANSINVATTELMDNANLTLSLKNQIDHVGDDFRKHVERDNERFALVRGGYIVASIVAGFVVALLAWFGVKTFETFQQVTINSQRLSNLEAQNASDSQRLFKLEERMGVKQ